MGVFDRFRTPVVSEKEGATSLREVMENYDLVEVKDDYLIVVERAKKLADPTTLGADTRELGSSSPSPFTSWSRMEYNTDLQGLQGLEKYDRMRKSDGTIRGILRLIKTPVLAGRWFVQAASEDQTDLDIAEFVEDCLWEHLGTSWPQFLTEALMMCEFGYYMFEKVWEYRMIDGVLRLVLAKLAPRHPMDVKQWHFDANGGPAGVEFWPFDLFGSYQEVEIPISKMLVFTFDQEAGNIEGISVLRSVYKHWYYKEQLYKIDAIQKERHGIGIPVIKLPLGYSPEDKIVANELGRNLRSNERAHVVLPPNWDLLFAKLEGHVVDSIKSIEHHNEMIRESVLAGFLMAKGRPRADEDHILFMKSTRFIADIICSSINQYLIPDLIHMNFGMDVELPELKVRRIGEQADWRTLSFAIRNFVGSGIIIPDDKLEEQIREELDLPAPDSASQRIQATPQGAKVGPPRQGPPSTKGSGTANSGKDGSGGH